MYIQNLLRHSMPEHTPFILDNSLNKNIQLLDDYTGHQLSDLKNASLMDRVDTKFLIPLEKLSLILNKLKPHYSSLDIDGKRIFTYHNTYFDTAEHLFYHMHHQGKLNRYKVRHRYYADTQTGFLEVKLKNNKGRTIKSRTPSLLPNLNETNELFLQTKLGNYFQCLQETQRGSYQRIALANEKNGERLTFDMNLCFQSIDNSHPSVQLPNMFIAELKQSRHNSGSPFSHLMAKLNIRPTQFSKYCIGCSLVTPSLKANRFKPQLLSLQKLH